MGPAWARPVCITREFGGISQLVLVFSTSFSLRSPPSIRLLFALSPLPDLVAVVAVLVALCPAVQHTLAAPAGVASTL